MNDGSARRSLRVRVYKVRFGDAVLVSIPDAGTIRHILIDVGNVQSGEGGSTEVFRSIFDDVRRELENQPLDLYVSTHEHMDHVKGMKFAADNLGISLPISHAWLTASAAPDYYERFPAARQKKRLAQLAFNAAQSYFAAGDAGGMLNLLANNDYRQTDLCVEHLRTIANVTSYVYRGHHLVGSHPFTEARLTILAPEEDLTRYYGRFQPLAHYASGIEPDIYEAPPKPHGVETEAFAALWRGRLRSLEETIFSIDKAANNTSIVFTLEWSGWRLLFPGDAEIRSWRTMAKYDVLRPVHFLKIAHHGSHNGTPGPAILEMILPPKTSDDRMRHAVLSTWPNTYPGVPHDETVEVLRQLCQIHSVLDNADSEGGFDLFLREDGTSSAAAFQLPA